ncbi:hypothetical protein PROPEN_03076 [Proteus penneri ATCC 35198]|nr:hypothetical protein PROPEN_03076 [Proteus penneri ATCC 35198]
MAFLFCLLYLLLLSLLRRGLLSVCWLCIILHFDAYSQFTAY